MIEFLLYLPMSFYLVWSALLQYAYTTSRKQKRINHSGLYLVIRWATSPTYNKNTYQIINSGGASATNWMRLWIGRERERIRASWEGQCMAVIIFWWDLPNNFTETKKELKFNSKEQGTNSISALEFTTISPRTK